jgi:hypothetical protein
VDSTALRRFDSSFDMICCRNRNSYKHKSIYISSVSHSTDVSSANLTSNPTLSILILTIELITEVTPG